MQADDRQRVSDEAAEGSLLDQNIPPECRLALRGDLRKYPEARLEPSEVVPLSYLLDHQVPAYRAIPRECPKRRGWTTLHGELR